MILTAAGVKIRWRDEVAADNSGLSAFPARTLTKCHQHPGEPRERRNRLRALT